MKVLSTAIQGDISYRIAIRNGHVSSHSLIVEMVGDVTGSTLTLLGSVDKSNIMAKI